MNLNMSLEILLICHWESPSIYPPRCPAFYVSGNSARNLSGNVAGNLAANVDRDLAGNLGNSHPTSLPETIDGCVNSMLMKVNC